MENGPVLWRLLGVAAPLGWGSGFELGDEDGAPPAGADLPARVRVRLADTAGPWMPPPWMPGADVESRSGRIVVRYLAGLRGTLGETGVALEPLTAAAWRRLRAGRPDLPDLDSDQAVRAWVEAQGGW